MDDPDRIARVFGKPMEVKPAGCNRTVEKFLPNRSVRANHVIDLRFERQPLVNCEIPLEAVITL
jgi:hypothetical protein